MIKVLYIVLIPIFSLAIISCSKKDSSSSSSSSSYKITGKISGNGASSRSYFSTSSNSNPDKIVAMYNHGQTLPLVETTQSFLNL